MKRYEVNNMKYMHFNSSCAYAALANMAESRGLDTEDYEIALEMKLPFLFAKDADGYMSGPMLQSSAWFNLWLLPHGWMMNETRMDRVQVCGFLRRHEDAMLGIKTPNGKHAVVYRGYELGYSFLNPIREGDEPTAFLHYDEPTLLEKLDREVMVATLHPTEKMVVSLLPYLEESVSVLEENVAAIETFACVKHVPEEYNEALNTLFRPLLLDGISMLELVKENNLAETLRELQGELMGFMRSNRTGCLSDALDIQKLKAAAKQYERLIVQAIQEEKS